MRKLGVTKDKQMTSCVENSIQAMHLIRCKYKLLKRKKKL